MHFYPLEKLHQLYNGYRRAFTVNGQSLLLVQDEDRVYLLVNRCPHMDAPLTHASVSAGRIRCPMHGIEFDLSTGRPLNAAARTLTKLPPAYEGNQIGVYLQPET